MNTASVFVVDDDPAICRIIHRMLSDEQCKVETSQSVADALQAIEQESFDVYVIDYKLPDGSGLDVAERVRSKWGATPIIFISGYDPSAVALRAEKLGIADFLKKPFSRELICNAVKKAIGSPKAASKLSQAVLPVSAVATKPTKSRFWRSISNVLVVDDDNAVCRIVRWMLSNEPYQVQTGQSVADAFQAIDQKPSGVVGRSDCRMCRKNSEIELRGGPLRRLSNWLIPSPSSTNSRQRSVYCYRNWRTSPATSRPRRRQNLNTPPPST